MPAAAVAAAKLLQSCPTLCDPRDGSPPGSPVPGILQARTLEWVAISFSNAWKWKVKVKSAQSCPTPSDTMDCSPPGSSDHGIFQARVLEWGATAFSMVMPGDIWIRLLGADNVHFDLVCIHFVKIHWAIHLKYLHFILCILFHILSNRMRSCRVLFKVLVGKCSHEPLGIKMSKPT